jgi:hypothetical protein
MSAMSALPAPISVATAVRAASAARSPRLKSKPVLVQSSMSWWQVSASRRLARPTAAVLR